MSDKNIIKIGVLSECFNKWERRIPLTPKHIKLLELEHNLKFIVQPSSTRIYNNSTFINKGITISEDLSECSIIFGVKQPKIEELMDNKTYLFFSHTIKAQPDNMHLLDECLKKKIRLIDYEKICDDNGRLVAFGKFAGICGCIDTLSGVGEFLLKKGEMTPLLYITPSYFYKDYSDAKMRLKDIGLTIKDVGVSNKIKPFIIGITSNGRCSKGVQKIMNLFCSVKFVKPEDLSDLFNKKSKPNKIYYTVFEQRHMVRHKDSTKEFDKNDYYKNPKNYVSIFADTYLEYVNILFNCMYWDDRYPRLITKLELKNLAETNRLRLLAINDITSDYMGSIEINEITTVIEYPYFNYEPVTMQIRTNYKDYSDGILYNSVDNLPSQFPKDAAKLFSKKLFKFVEFIAISQNINDHLDNQNLPDEIKRAVICYNGELADNYRYINKLRKIREEKKREDEKNFIKKMRSNKRDFKYSQTIYVEGHLFDKLILNRILDLFTVDETIYPNIIHWQIGNGFDKHSAVTLKINYDNEQLYNEQLSDIMDLCNKNNCIIEEK